MMLAVRHCHAHLLLRAAGVSRNGRYSRASGENSASKNSHDTVTADIGGWIPAICITIHPSVATPSARRFIPKINMFCYVILRNIMRCYIMLCYAIPYVT